MKKRLCWQYLGCVFIFFSLSGVLQAQRSDSLMDALDLPITEHRLDNGLRLVLQPLPGATQIAMELRYPFGEGDSSISGMPHLIEHLMFEHSAHAPERAYERLLHGAGGRSNAEARVNTRQPSAWQTSS